MSKRPKWEVRVSLDADLFYHSYTLVGLQQLASEGIVALREGLACQSPMKAAPHDLVVLFFEVRPYGHDKWRCVAYDLLDDRSLFCHPSLAVSDVYFKANYSPDGLRDLPDELARRVRPAGLHLSVRPYTDAWALCRTFGRSLVAPVSPANYACLSTGIARSLHVPKSFLSACKHRLAISQYEGFRGAKVVQRQVFFNASCWPSVNGSDCSDLRAQVIRRAKANGACSFVGGLRPSTQAKALYPDLIFEPEPKHKEYMEFVAQSEVVINTLGYHQCFSWKLTEYLAAGKCILSEQLANELPHPLRHGEELYLFAGDLSDFDSRLGEVLGDQALRAHLEAGARRYYDQWVKPSSAMAYLLESATESV